MGAKARRADSKGKGGAKRRKEGKGRERLGGAEGSAEWAAPSHKGGFLPLKVASGPWGQALHVYVPYGIALGLLGWEGPLRSPCPVLFTLRLREVR